MMASFGVTGEVQNINPDEIELIENHKFEEINTYFLEKFKFKFKDTRSLIKSLDEKPKKLVEEELMNVRMKKFLNI